MAEQRLPGGNSLGAVRIGDTVHRAAQPWTNAVHALLRHLEAVGFDGAPRARGFDHAGREVLTYLDGETVGDRHPWPGWVHSDTALVDVARWTRRLHNATEMFVPPEDAVWFAGQSWRPGLVVGHHDAAPYNAVWQDDRLVGFVDWDTAGPSPRDLDLAFVALSWVPLHARRVVEREGFTAFDDRSRRLHLLLDSYGYEGDRSAFRTAVTRRAQMNIDGIQRLAAGGDPTYVALLPVVDDVEQAMREIDALPAGFWRQPGS